MIHLPNNCKCSTPSISPKNWRDKDASLSDDWYVQYYFYNYDGKKKLVIAKGGVNYFKTLKERRAEIADLLNKIINLLTKDGYNPVTNKITESPGEINYITTLLNALKYSQSKLQVASSTKSDIKSMMNYLEAEITKQGLTRLPVIEVKRKHILQLIEPIESPHKFNKYRSYISVLFNLIDDIIENNPAAKIKKRKTVKKLRDIMTLEERKKVNENLKTNYYTFWRFMQIFYHSGARVVELLRVQVKDVDIANQRFKVTVLKGQQPVQMWRTIKDIALPFWMELIQGSKPQQYIFSEWLKPGDTQIRREQITRRWHMHVVEKLGIDKTFYSLKHSAATDTAELLGNLEAAKHMGHTDETMVKKVYNVEYENRKRLTVKELKNEL